MSIEYLDLIYCLSKKKICVACPLNIQEARRSTLVSEVFCGDFVPSSSDSRRASCQLLSKEWALDTGKLPLGGLLRKSVVNQLTILT